MPKTIKNIWNRVIDLENLFWSFVAAAKNKRYHVEVLRYEKNLESNLLLLQNQLITKTWAASPCKKFHVQGPKPRTIHAPQFKDRVLHHALIRNIESILEQGMIKDSYACRKGKGREAANERLALFMQLASKKYGQRNFWFLKADIKKYYPHVNHEILMTQLRRKIGDPNVLWLCRQIITGYEFEECGMPIGAYTSQIFANVYLDRLDHFIKDALGFKWYLRYMDDFVITHHDKEVLRNPKETLNVWLWDNLKLELNKKTYVDRADHGILFTGFKEYGTHTRPTKKLIARIKRIFKHLSSKGFRDKSDLNKIHAIIASYLGILSHCDAYHTTKSVLRHLVLHKRRKTND